MYPSDRQIDIYRSNKPIIKGQMTNILSDKVLNIFTKRNTNDQKEHAKINIFFKIQLNKHNEYAFPLSEWL